MPCGFFCLVIVLRLLEWSRVLHALRIFQRLRMDDFHKQHIRVKFCFKIYPVLLFY